ncbi:EAL domain-containing protein [Modestobacter sp. NPDC049651]|uniref:putative bifunctional diguanylate cyclase/phosphodiesterase n=1 Tax=unclassified Modestobacter TaxID=2643866 RepID=UPI0034071B49
MNVKAWHAYATAGGVVLAGYFLLPAGIPRDSAYVAVGLSSVAAVVAGIRLHRPARPAAWWAMAAGQLSWVTADALFSWYDDVLHVSPYPSPADAFYLAAYPILGGGIVVLIRVRQRRLDLAGSIDSAVVTIALGLVSWLVIAGPIVHSAEAVPTRLVSLAYPAGDILLLALLARLVTTPGARTASFRLLGAAVGTMLLADVGYAVITARTDYDSGAFDLLWLASYVLWGAAALHPSMRSLSERCPGEPAPFSGRRLAALGIAVLVAPGALAVQLTFHLAVQGWPVVVASVALFGLVVARMHLAIREIVAAGRRRTELQQELAHQAAYDSLTGLANRAHVLELIGAAMHRARRSGTQLALLALDLDGFKAVNDTFGHQAGDEVLRVVAQRMRAVVRVGDTVGRLAGDEFVVLVEPLEESGELLDLGDRLIAAVAAPISVGGREVTVGVSIGAAVSSDGGTDADALLHHADAATYRAKTAGRGRVELFDEALRRQLDEQACLEDAVRTGLAAGEFVLHYQPVLALSTGRLLGYEALIRWERPGYGLVPPDLFIPVAEQSTLICEVGRWVLGEATRQLAAWRAADPAAAELTVAVNVSGRQLASPGVVDDVAAALAASGLPASALVVEITETVLVDRLSTAERLAELRALGVGVSIDDFGTGYTSIGQLQHLSVDTLKIDRSFVSSPGPGTVELVRLMINAAHAFGLTVVAEGIEDAEQLALLERLACDAGQGYLFSKPRPAADLPPASVALLPGSPAAT